ncbi:MAG: hypothetical protein JSW20_04875 [Nitrospiraceae bacterium]|nr:MAG: hypothetical protein JSW20_04875 [Nitrospiraceae bacterium]
MNDLNLIISFIKIYRNRKTGKNTKGENEYPGCSLTHWFNVALALEIL